MFTEPYPYEPGEIFIPPFPPYPGEPPFNIRAGALEDIIGDIVLGPIEAIVEAGVDIILPS